MAKHEIHKQKKIFDPAIVKRALVDALKKLDPRVLWKNPVMFVVEVGAVLTTGSWINEMASKSGDPTFSGLISAWLWFTVYFATFAEAMAEGRGKAQADALRKTKTDTMAKLMGKDGSISQVNATMLRKGDIVLVEAGDTIPGDGDASEGIASIDESAITGESAPVIRESGGDRSAVTGGTRVISDWLKVKITSNPGETFIDRMIGLVEGAKRQKTPNEIALTILLSGMTIIFVVALVALNSFAIYMSSPVSIVVMVSLLVCLIPTTIGGLLSAIGIAGIDRVLQRNVLAMSGRAVEAAGDVNTLLLDKTGTITIGNRMATAFIPAEGVTMEALAMTAYLASLSDETPEGRSIVTLAQQSVKELPPNISHSGENFHPILRPHTHERRRYWR